MIYTFFEKNLTLGDTNFFDQESVLWIQVCITNANYQLKLRPCITIESRAGIIQFIPSEFEIALKRVK